MNNDPPPLALVQMMANEKEYCCVCAWLSMRLESMDADGYPFSCCPFFSKRLGRSPPEANDSGTIIYQSRR